MPVFEIDPLQDARWNPFVESHTRSSVFHTSAWIEALRQTYSYKPIAFTTSPGGASLTNGIVFCRTDSWLTGSKLVSLPFSDHCDPLLANKADLGVLLAAIGEKMAGDFKYAEIRPRFVTLEPESDWARERLCHFHCLDLRPSIEDLYSSLHKDGVQRKIRRADREHVVLVEGRSEELLQEFFQLLLRTRRRHGLPPQPIGWFRTLIQCLGSLLTIRVARVGGMPIASILTLTHKKTLVYKYGCSDERLHNLGGMPRLFWQAIKDAKADGFEEFDLGRSDEGNDGLVRFKDHLGAIRASITYWQYPRNASVQTGSLNTILKSALPQKLLYYLPDRLLRLAGEILYRHAG